MIKNEYIFLDLETTGCRPTIDRIIEIGFYHVVGNQIISEWNQLINPEMVIPTSISNLTGITNEMVSNMPSFSDIACDLVAKIKNYVLVAHNARFDYAFLKNELKRQGITYQAKTLCTLKLSRILFPEYKTHNLDTISKRFNLTALPRHRALADAHVLVNLIQYLTNTIQNEILQAAIKKSIQEHSLPAHLPSNLISTIPTNAGVYFFYGENDALLYIGKSNSLRNRVLSHFSSDYTSNKEMQLAQQTRKIEWSNSAGELGALLKEAQLIKERKPIFNRQLRRHKSLFSIELLPQSNQYHLLKIVSFKEIQPDNIQNVYGLFRQKKHAEDKLRDLVKAYALCPKLCGLEKARQACFYYQIHKCNGACIGKECMNLYNSRLKESLSALKYRVWPYQGKIALQETCQKTNHTELHIIEQWCYLGTINNIHELENLNIDVKKLIFDVDIYKLLVKYILGKKADVEIVIL